jgi:gliding motility-associated-like protein
VDTTEEMVNVKGVNIYYIPNSFSPEKESFKPVFSAGLDVYDYHFTIYNRYGEILFESYNESYGWNGMYGDNGFVPVGVYVWKLEFGDLTTDERHTEVGHVNVMR